VIIMAQDEPRLQAAFIEWMQGADPRLIQFASRVAEALGQILAPDADGQPPEPPAPVSKSESHEQRNGKEKNHG
jgi:hypothetical protein